MLTLVDRHGRALGRTEIPSDERLVSATASQLLTIGADEMNATVVSVYWLPSLR